MAQLLGSNLKFTPSRSTQVNISKQRSQILRAKDLDYDVPSPPLVGQPGPAFKGTGVYEQEFLDIDFTKYQGKYLVVFFYPLDFTFVCPTEITAFSDRYEDFKKLNCEVLAVSVDSQFSHLAWTQTPREEGGVGELNYPLVSDLTKEISMSFGVLDEASGTALRGLFVIDTDGVIQHSTINNAPLGRNVDEVIRTVQAVKYVKENPDQVCPAGWQPGAESMSPTQSGKKDFFKKL